MRTLPTSWEWRDLEHVAADERASITDGPFGSNLKTAHYTESGPRVIRLQNIGDGVFIDEKAHISQDHYERLTKHAVQAGDLVVASLGKELPRSCLIPEWVPPAIVKADCIRVRPGPGIDVRYLNHYLNSPECRQRASEIIHGVGRPRLNLSEIRRIPVPVAPVNEQRRIVEAIETHFSHLDAGVKSLQRARGNVGRMRASTLEAAVRGRLVSQDPDEDPVSDLFSDEILDVIMETPEEQVSGLPPGWVQVPAGAICEVQGGITKHPKRSPERHHYPYLRVANVRRNELDLGEIHDFELFDGELERYRLETGDLLVVEGNGSRSQIGRSAIWRGEIDDCVHQNHIIRVRPMQAVVPSYLNLYWNAPSTAEVLAEVASSTSGLYTLSTGKVKAVPVRLPPYAEQERIVEETGRQLSILDVLRVEVDQALSRSAALRNSVLAAAFSGRLGDGAGVAA